MKKLVDDIYKDYPIETDPFGSYTGVPADPNDPYPEQDADDL